MPHLAWITDKDLIAAIACLRESFERGRAQAERDINKNVIDPFYALFGMVWLGMEHDHWMEMEKARQIGKSLNNAIGLFHQQVLGSIPGWHNLGTGGIVDLANDDRKIIAELKNKYNTVKGSDRIGIYEELSDAVHGKNSIYKDYTAYYVTVIPQSSEGVLRPFTPSNNAKGKRAAADEQIIEIDGRRFYALATGHDDALDELFDAVSEILFSDHSHLTESQRDGDIRQVKQLFNKAFIGEM